MDSFYLKTLSSIFISKVKSEVLFFNEIFSHLRINDKLTLQQGFLHFLPPRTVREVLGLYELARCMLHLALLGEDSSLLFYLFCGNQSVEI